MGLILEPTEIKNCTKQMKSQLESNRNSYDGALQTVQKFAGNDSFKSESWDTLKGKVIGSHQLISSGMMALHDCLQTDLDIMAGILSGAESLDEDMLIQDILRLQEECNRYIEMIQKLRRLATNSMIYGVNTTQLLISTYQEMLQKTKIELEILIIKLKILREKADHTSALFTSIGTLIQAVEWAINDAEVYISGRGTLSDESWKMVIPDKVEEYYKRKNRYALENFLYIELGIAIDEFEGLYGEETISNLCESVNAIGIEEINDETKDKVITIILEQTSGQKVAKVDDKYQFLYGEDKVMLEFEKDKVGEIIMDVTYSNTDVKKKYIAGYLKEHLPECDDIHIAAIMGNMQAESEFSPLKKEGRSQDLYNPEYIEEYDIYDSIGWGLFQWTYYSRKQGLQEYADEKARNSDKSFLGDMDTQLEYLVIEFKGEERKEGHKKGELEKVYNTFITIENLDDATEYLCIAAENPKKGFERFDERKQCASVIYSELTK